MMSAIKSYYHDEIVEGMDEPGPREMDEMLMEAHEIMEEMDFWWRAMNGDADYIAGLDDGEGPKEGS